MKSKRMSKTYSDLMYATLFFILMCLLVGVFNFAFGSGDNQFSQQAQSAVEKQGYTDILPLGMDYISCASNGEGANAGYAFEATNMNGARVWLTACKTSGFLHPFGGWYIVTR